MNSPCNNICKIDDPTGWCIGCGRTLTEITKWGSASPRERRAIKAKLPKRLKQLRQG